MRTAQARAHITGKKLLAVLLAAVLAASLFPAVALAQEEAFALGAFDPTTKTYKNASGSGTALYRGISIGFSQEIAGGESIKLPSMTGFTYKSDLSSDYSKVIDLGTGKTASQIAGYVKKIVFDNCGAGQTVTVSLSEGVLEYKTIYFGGNQHFYQYVEYESDFSVDRSWSAAYNAAKAMEHNGRGGYLATITSLAEDMFIYQATSSAGWLGGTRLNVDTAATGYIAHNWRTWQFQTEEDPQTGDHWYWACGPEAGTEFYPAATRSMASGQTSQLNPYSNWGSAEPNNSGTESCLVTLPGVNGEMTPSLPYSWNDISNDSFMGSSGFFVEFGDELIGDSSDDPSSAVTAPIAVDGEVPQSFPQWAKDAGLTEGTSAAWAGRPLPSTLTLNANITLTAPIILPKGTNLRLDLNGHTLTAPEGEPAIDATGGVSLTITSSAGGGSVVGDSGADSAAGAGGDGMPAIDLSASDNSNQSYVTVNGGVTIQGGSGGNVSAVAGNGGAGGEGIRADESGGYVSVTVSGGASVNGGNGGNAVISPGVGGTGGLATGSFNKTGDAYTDGTNGTTPPNITTTVLPDSKINLPYSQTLAVAGDTPITWGLEGELPTGLTFVNGVISGTPISLGTFSFTVSAQNASTGAVGRDTQAFTIRISNELLASPTGLAWDAAVPGRATWAASANAASYLVQLFNEGAATGDPVSVSSGTSCDLAAAILAAGGGEYTFQVMAVSNNAAYGSSPWSAGSANPPCIAHTFQFKGNPGRGSMPAGTVLDGLPYTLPACVFIPPKGMAFETWECSYLNTDFQEITVRLAPGESYTFASVLDWVQPTISALYVPWEPAPPSASKGGGGYPDTTVYNDPNASRATIWLTGSGLSSNDLLITQALTSGGDYNAMLRLANGEDVFRVYDIYLKSGKRSTGTPMYLHFDLSEKYAGQSFTLAHKKADGTYEYFYATADAKGDLVFGPLYELSPFMLVRGSQRTLGVAGIPQTGRNGLAGYGALVMAGLLAWALLTRRRGAGSGRRPARLYKI